MHEQHNSRSWALDYKANRSFPLSHFSRYCPPITRLPVELLSEIFLYACTFRRGYHGNLIYDLSPFDRRASPMNVSHVNSDWRNVAISLPRLWGNLHILCMLPRSPALLQLWLQRSRDSPLHIALETRRYCWSSRAPDACTCEIGCPLHEDPQTNEILSLLVEHSARWENIDFNICTYRATPLLSLKIGDLPMLKSVCFLDIFSQDYNVGITELDSTRVHQDVFWKVVAESPLLEEVIIWKNLPHHLHWDRLRSLSIDEQSDLQYLTECSLLESLSIQECGPIVDPNSRILLPNLKNLHISIAPWRAGLDSFTLPSLRTLHLTIDSPSKSLQDIEQFMQHSSPPLQSLIIKSTCSWGAIPPTKHTAEDTASLISLLSSSAMAQLRSLTIMGSPVPLKFLSHLSLQSVSFLPCLEKLTIEYSVAISMSDITHMIAFRSGGREDVAPLQNFEAVIRNSPWTTEDIKQLYSTIPLGEMQYKGCKIVMRSYEGVIPIYFDRF